MSLEIKIKHIMNNFDDVSSDEFLEILDISTESEKKKQCKLLLPYYDWYLQGL